MADSTVDALTAASALDGTEEYYAVQGGADRKVTGAQIKTLASASPALVTPNLGTPTAGVLTSCTGLPAVGGGTGQSTYVKGDLLASPGSNTLNKLAVGSDGKVLTADAASTNGVKWAAAASGSMSIGGAVTSGTSGSVLYVDGSANLAQQNTKLFWDATNFVFKVGAAGDSAAYYLNGVAAIYEVPNGTANSWFVGEAGTTTGSGSGNTGIGANCLFRLTTGFSNTSVGAKSSALCTTGDSNTAVGYSALIALTTGSRNVALGVMAANVLNTGSDNFALGSLALGAVTSASVNVAVGTNSLSVLASGEENIGVGCGSFIGLTSGNSNISIGTNCAYHWGSGISNTIIGPSGAFNITGGDKNTLVGAWEGPSASISNVIALTDGADRNATDGKVRGVDYGYTTAGVWSFQYLTTAIGLRVYNTTDSGAPPTNYERAVFDWNVSANVLSIGTQAGGTGTLRNIAFVGGTVTFPAASIIQTTSTVAALPAAGTAGRRAFVTDATATTFASIVAGTGGNPVPVYDDGTNWRIG